jgi:hypothetical protein
MNRFFQKQKALTDLARLNIQNKPKLFKIIGNIR